MLGKIDMFANQAAKGSDPKNEGNNQPMPAPLPAPASKPAETTPNAEESGSESDDDQGSEEDYITTPDGQRVAWLKKYICFISDQGSSNCILIKWSFIMVQLPPLALTPPHHLPSDLRFRFPTTPYGWDVGDCVNASLRANLMRIPNHGSIQRRGSPAGAPWDGLVGTIGSIWGEARRVQTCQGFSFSKIKWFMS